MNDSLLNWLSAAAATVASLVGVVIAVGQLTSASRLRRRASFWREQLQGNNLPQDYAVAQSFHRDATARLIALQAYPGWIVFVWVFIALIAALAVGGMAFSIQSISTDGFTFPNVTSYESSSDIPSQREASFLILPIAVPCFFLALCGSCNFIVLRRLLARRYLQGLDLRQDQHIRIRLSFWAQIRVFLFCGGVALLIFVVSFQTSLRMEDPSVAAELPDWWALIQLLVAFLLFQGFFPVMDMFAQEADDWEHPRNLPSQAEASQAGQVTWRKRLANWSAQHSPLTKR